MVCSGCTHVCIYIHIHTYYIYRYHICAYYLYAPIYILPIYLLPIYLLPIYILPIHILLIYVLPIYVLPILPIYIHTNTHSPNVNSSYMWWTRIYISHCIFCLDTHMNLISIYIVWLSVCICIHTYTYIYIYTYPHRRVIYNSFSTCI